MRLATTRNADMAMFGGRMHTYITYDVGFDDEGRVLALNIHGTLLGGAYMEVGWWASTTVVNARAGDPSCYQQP